MLKYRSLISRGLVAVLSAVAAVVLIGLIRQRDMWEWIIAYWTILTIKNILDSSGGIKCR